MDPVEGRSAADFLVGSVVRAPDGVWQGGDAAFADEPGHVPGGRAEGAEVGEERRLFHWNPTNIGVRLIISPYFRLSSV